jgi:Ser/Thr protein kinase RdoA (MazF antagonist)
VRELSVASHAARAGAPVIPPADEVDPGPHRRDGHVVTFWRYIESKGDVDAHAAGRGLRTVHEALGDYDGELPEAGHPQDLDEMLASLDDSADVEFLRTVASDRPDVEGQALHGDAHLQNCIASVDGPLWHDFETACLGPREYDLAALLQRELIFGDRPDARIALAAYGDYDASLVQAWMAIYVVWVLVSMLTALPRRPELRAQIDARLRWLRRR